MGKATKKGSGLMLVAAGLLAGYAVLRQGQTAADTLTSARVKGFELKSLAGGSLNALAKVEFSNTDVKRDTVLQALAMNVSYNGEVISTLHLSEPQALPANQDTTISIPVSLKLTSLLSQAYFAGKVPPLASFTNLAKLRTWLAANISTEVLRLQGTAQVDGAAVRFDQPLNLSDYLPTAPRPGPEPTLSPRRTTAALPASTRQPAAGPPARLAPVLMKVNTAAVVPSQQPVARRPALAPVVRAGKLLVRKAAPLGPVVKAGAALVRNATPLARQAAALIRQTGQRKPRPVTSGKQPIGPTGRTLSTPVRPVPYS